MGQALEGPTLRNTLQTEDSYRQGEQLAQFAQDGGVSQDGGISILKAGQSWATRMVGHPSGSIQKIIAERSYL